MQNNFVIGIGIVTGVVNVKTKLKKERAPPPRPYPKFLVDQ